MRNAVTLGMGAAALVQRSDQVHLHALGGTSLFGFAQDDQSAVVNRALGNGFFDTLLAGDGKSTFAFSRMRTFASMIFATSVVD